MKRGYEKLTMVVSLLGQLLAVLPVSAQDVLIDSESKLRAFATSVNSGTTNYSGQTICLTTNITLELGAWTPIGTSGHPFNGHFEGWGHTISGVSISASESDYQGLFGYVDGGSIHDIAVTGSGSVTGRNYVGGICGYLASGEILCCYSEIAVMGTGYVGGICGRQTGGKIKDCYVKGNVSGTAGYYFGAVVGGKTGAGSTLKNCLYDNSVILTYAIGDDEEYGLPSYDDEGNRVMPFTTITDENIDTWAMLNDEANNMVWKLTEGSYPQLHSFLKNEPMTFTFTEGKHWLTVCPNGNYTVPAGMEAYIVSSIGADYVSLKEVTTLNEGRGTLLYSETAGSFTATSTDDALDDYSADSWLKGSHVSPVTIGGADKNDYILSNSKFIRAQSGQLARGKAYLCLPVSSSVKQLLNIMMDDSTDGIREIKNAPSLTPFSGSNGGSIYDLSGRRITNNSSTLPKSVYIVNGKKVIK